MKKSNTFSRKDFLKNSTLALTGLSMTHEFSQYKISSDNTAQLLGSNNSGISDLIGSGLLSGVMQGGEQMVAGNSLLGLLNDILDFSKVEAGKLSLDPEPFDVDQLLRVLAVLLSASVGD